MTTDPFGNFEMSLGQAMQGDSVEKTRYDKLLAKEDSARLRDLAKKEFFNLDEVDEILNICVSIFPKLSRLEENERKLLGLFFIRIDIFAKRFKDAIGVYKHYLMRFQNGDAEVTWRVMAIRAKIIKEYIGQFKLNVNSYQYALGSSLSVQGNMIDSLTINTQDIQYSVPPGFAPPQNNQGWIGNR